MKGSAKPVWAKTNYRYKESFIKAEYCYSLVPVIVFY